MYVFYPLNTVITFVLVVLVALATHAADEDQWVVYEGKAGRGHGKHIVLVSGDEEYRSEEALPQLGKVLAVHHGFKCTVLFALDPDGTINPKNLNNIPGLEALKTADLMIIATRFRDLPDDQMRQIDNYLQSGRPVLGLRTATHGFRIESGKTFAHYDFKYRGDQSPWTDGFGRLVLGETWISHHGWHKKQSTRGVIAKGAQDHPIVRGLKDGEVWGPTDVYGVRLPLPGDCKPILMGQVLEGMDPDNKPATKDRDGQSNPNDPMMPIAWTKSYQLPGGTKGRVFTTTLGASTDLVSMGTRRMIVNAVYWCVGLEGKIPAEGTKVDLVGQFDPSPYGFGGFREGLRPADHKL